MRLTLSTLEMKIKARSEREERLLRTTPSNSMQSFLQKRTLQYRDESIRQIRRELLMRRVEAIKQRTNKIIKIYKKKWIQSFKFQLTSCKQMLSTIKILSNNKNSSKQRFKMYINR